MPFEIGDRVEFTQDVSLTGNTATIPKGKIGCVTAVDNNIYSVEVFKDFIVNGIPENSLRLIAESINDGRRYIIINSIVERLKLINRKNPMPQTAFASQAGTEPRCYPFDISYVSLRSETPDSLIGDNLLPALLVQYGDGMRSYSTGPKGYSRIGEVTEYMTVIVRAVVQQMRNPASPLEFIPLTLVIANLHEAIESAVGDGPNLGVPGVRAIMIPKWDTHDCWGLDFEVIDFQIKVLHVFKRGEGV